MIEMTLMDPSKETDNKLRWEIDIEGVKFKLYIPKRRVPQPWPNQITVTVNETTGNPPPRAIPAELSSPVIATVERTSEHSQTARFTPSGDPQTWEIGEPYIPYQLLPRRNVSRLDIEVSWDYSNGTWTPPSA